MKKIVSLPAHAMPALYFPGDRSRGLPEKAMWPKAPMRIGNQQIVVDALVRLVYPGQNPALVVLEIDEDQVTPESRHRERLLSQVDIPVVRLTAECVCRPDMMEHLDRKLQAAAARGKGRMTRILGFHEG